MAEYVDPVGSPTSLDCFTSCSICFEVFTDPKILDCLHTFCEPCLSRMPTQRGRLTCPTCRQVTPLPATGGTKGLRTDFRTNQLIDKVKTRATKKGGECIFCKAEANTFCFKCKIMICANCAEQHKRKEQEEDHELTPLHNDLLCKRHHGNLCLKYCFHCERGVCKACFIIDCINGHRWVEMKVEDSYRKKLRDECTKLDKRANLLKQRKVKKTRFQENINEIWIDFEKFLGPFEGVVIIGEKKSEFLVKISEIISNHEAHQVPRDKYSLEGEDKYIQKIEKVIPQIEKALNSPIETIKMMDHLKPGRADNDDDKNLEKLAEQYNIAGVQGDIHLLKVAFITELKMKISLPANQFMDGIESGKFLTCIFKNNSFHTLTFNQQYTWAGKDSTDYHKVINPGESVAWTHQTADDGRSQACHMFMYKLIRSRTEFLIISWDIDKCNRPSMKAKILKTPVLPVMWKDLGKDVQANKINLGSSSESGWALVFSITGKKICERCIVFSLSGEQNLCIIS